MLACLDLKAYCFFQRPCMVKDQKQKKNSVMQTDLTVLLGYKNVHENSHTTQLG